MKPSELIQAAIDQGIYQGYGNVPANNEFMCCSVKLVDADNAHKTISIIEDRLACPTLYGHLLTTGEVIEPASDETLRAAQFKFWREFIVELQERGL